MPHSRRDSDVSCARGKHGGSCAEEAGDSEAVTHAAPAESPERAADRASLRRVLLPTEHGGWAFLAEPVLLGLLVAGSRHATRSCYRSRSRPRSSPCRWRWTSGV